MTEASVVAAAVAAAKAMVRVEGTGEDAVMHRLVRAAIEAAEAFCGQRLAEREVEQALIGRGTGTGAWQALAERPVAAIASVTGTGGTTLAVGSYAIDLNGGTGRIRLPAGIPALVTYRAGMAARWSLLPAPIAHGVVLLAVHWWENRTEDPALPAAVAALWRPFRRMGIGG